jgi:hypothetical protein
VKTAPRRFVDAGMFAFLMAGQVGAIYAAAPVNQIPSCYVVNPVRLPTPKPAKHLFILIDQTTPLDTNLQLSLATITRSLVKPGTAFSIYSFSAYSQGRYLNLKAMGILETPIPKNARGSIGVKVLKNFDKCMAGQYQYGLNLALKADQAAVQQSAIDLRKSDVISTLSEVSRQVKASNAPSKTILIVSDMLENSSVSTFYSKNTMRRIDPEKELAIVDQNNMFGDFDEAAIYVLGAGLVQETSKPVYRDPKTMQALKTFWDGYFKKSNGNLIEFGAPGLIGEVR